MGNKNVKMKVLVSGEQGKLGASNIRVLNFVPVMYFSYTYMYMCVYAYVYIHVYVYLYV